MRSSQDLTTKPYYKCLSCARFRKVCGGIPTRGMDLHDWCEYMRDVKELSKLTNNYIAEAAEVSLRTIERIMAINIEQDIMRSTARRIEMSIIGQVGEHACYMNSDGLAAERINELLAEVAYWKNENARKARIIDKWLE